jgi:hypothetical protein
MGNGASSKEVNAHIRRWDKAIGDLSALCRDHRRVLGTSPGQQAHQPPSQQAPTPPNGRVLPSVIPALHDTDNGSRGGTEGFDADGGRRTSINFSIGKRDNIIAMSQGTELPESANTSPTNKARNSKTRARAMQKLRHEFFRSYELNEEERAEVIASKVPGSQFAVLAAGLTYLLGGHRNCEDRKQRVTVEDLFFTSEMPLHFLHQSSFELTSMFDIVQEFIDVDSRFKDVFEAEIVHMDIAPSTGQVERGTANDCGDRQRKVQIHDLRRKIDEDLTAGDAIHFVNFDPFVVEQDVKRDTGDDDDDTALSIKREVASFGGTSSAQESPRHGANKARSEANGFMTAPNASKENEGMFAMVASLHEKVSPMVTIAEAALLGDQARVSMADIPFATLFNGMTAPSQQQARPRGFIRVVRKRSEEEKEEENPYVDWMFSPELCSGKVLGTTAEGIHAKVVDSIVSPHVVAVSWALHFLRGMRPGTHRHGNGLPVSDIVRTLKLPTDVFLKTDLPLDQVFMYLSDYVNMKGLASQFRTELCPVLTTVSRADAVPTQTQSELEALLIEVEASNNDFDCANSVVIFQFDANIAHNVLGIADTPQWGIFAGYNIVNAEARIIDANPKRFSTSWTVSLDRLHTAITGYGYIIVAKQANVGQMVDAEEELSEEDEPSSPDAGSPAGRPVGALRHVTSTVRRRLDLLEGQRRTFMVEQPMIKTFLFPPVPLSITVAAAALTRLGTFTHVDDIAFGVGFDVNAILTRSLGLHPFVTIVTDYLARARLANKFALTPKFATADDACDGAITMAGFKQLLLDSLGEEQSKQTSIIVHFDHKMLTVVGADNAFGTFGIITGTERRDGKLMVNVGDANPNSFLRTWQVDIESLFKAMASRMSMRHRARGIIIVTRLGDAPSAASLAQPSRFRPFDIAIAPLQHAFLISSSPQIQGLSIAFAQLGHFYSPEEIFYEAYLKTVTAHRRRGSQAVAWRSVDVVLSVLNGISATQMAQVATRFLESRDVTNIAVSVLDNETPETFEARVQAATAPDCDHLLLVNYAVERVHGMAQMGNSVGLVQSLDAETRQVGIFEAEFSLFGLQWQAPLPTLMEACGVAGAEANASMGVVQMRRVSAEEAASNAQPAAAPAEMTGFQFGE